jgi:undecaprenyl diphosphate synthase
MAEHDHHAASALPVHIGIIMDGNGRWAHARSLPRTSGHLEGLKAAKRIIRAAAVRGIPYLTLYVFSTENWKRSSQEVSYLMGLIAQYIKREYPFYQEMNIRIRHSGDREKLPPKVTRLLDEAVTFTSGHSGLTVNLAVNYGGKNEILRAVQAWYTDSRAGGNPQELTEELFSQYLDNPDIPDADLIIRTANEKRMSNFLLWKGAYAEFYFSEKFWPDWRAADLDAALREYRNRRRRYGGIDQ